MKRTRVRDNRTPKGRPRRAGPRRPLRPAAKAKRAGKKAPRKVSWLHLQAGTRLWDASDTYRVVKIRKVGFGLASETSWEVFPFYRSLALLESYCVDHQIVRRER